MEQCGSKYPDALFDFDDSLDQLSNVSEIYANAKMFEVPKAESPDQGKGQELKQEIIKELSEKKSPNKRYVKDKGR